MVKIFVYDINNNVFELYNKELDEPMPYNLNGTLLVKEFLKNTKSTICWTTKEMMEAWNKTKEIWKRPIVIRDAFHRIYEPGFTARAGVTAGVTMSFGNMTEAVQNAFYLTISPYRFWKFINDPQYTLGYIELSDNYKTPACEYVTYPLLRLNDISTYVLALQDALIFLGYLPSNYLTGQFDTITRNGMMAFQTNNKLRVDGVAGCNSWQAIIQAIQAKNQVAGSS